MRTIGIGVAFKYCVFCFFSFVCLVAVATNLPLDGPLGAISSSLRGTAGKSIAIIGLFVSGALLVFGGDLPDLARRLTWLCLCMSLIFAQQAFLDIFSVVTGAPINLTAVLF